MAVGTQQRKVGQPIILPVPVNMIYFDGDFSSLSVALRPAAPEASFTIIIP